ncbi:hypothetical protein F5887DRAFT_979025 [Amanita rubescens]|nr:hypothetical protein F5887DRAFT_979025 [Amanita rubescens]
MRHSYIYPQPVAITPVLSCKTSVPRAQSSTCSSSIMDMNHIFKDYIDPALQKVYNSAADHPRYTALILLIWSLVPFLPCQILNAVLVQLPVQVITEIKDWIGYTPDQGVRPGSLAALMHGEGTEGPDGLLERLQLRLKSYQSYGAVSDSRTEEGRAPGLDDEEDEECECRDGCCCQGPINAIKFIRLLLQTSLFFSSVIIMVNSFKEGEGGKEPGKS